MNVIRHETVRKKSDRTKLSLAQKLIANDTGKPEIVERSHSVMRANRYEIGVEAAVFEASQTSGPIGHA